MVRLVVENEDIFHSHEFRHHALDHLTFGFSGLDLSTRAALEQRAAAFGDFQALAEHKRVVVSNDDLGSADILEQIFKETISRSL